MPRTTRAASRMALISVVAALLVLACTKQRGGPIAPADTSDDNAVPEFSLLDVNETSATAGEHVSPRDQLGEVSAWYFGHAT